MSANRPPIVFCEDCPFANGVIEAHESRSNFGMIVPNPGWIQRFVDGGENMTNGLRVQPVGRAVGNDMPGNVFADLTERAAECLHPTEVRKRLLGGLLGSKTVRECGMFPGQNPKKPATTVSTCINPDW